MDVTNDVWRAPRINRHNQVSLREGLSGTKGITRNKGMEAFRRQWRFLLQQFHVLIAKLHLNYAANTDLNLEKNNLPRKTTSP